MTEAHEQENSVSIRREFSASPERVFRAWTDPEFLAQWFGPEGLTCPDCQMDVREGGQFRVSMQPPEGDKIWVGGEYQEITPPKRLVFSWRWDIPQEGVDETTRVIVELNPTTSGTELVLTHELFSTPDLRDKHEMGWASSLNKLERFVSA